MKYQSELQATVLSEEYYECNECGATYESYSLLNHVDDNSGGFCYRCNSSDIEPLTQVTVYQELYVRQSGCPIETALELDEWKVRNSIIRLKGDTK